MNILNIENLCKSYNKKIALDNVSLKISKGQICGLLGLNGAGKSTLMKIICGLSIKNSGIVKILDTDIHNVEYCNNITGSMIESPSFYSGLTAFQNLQALSKLYNVKISKSYLNSLFDYVGLEEHKNLQINKYSLGMKQRLHFAQALLNSPKLIILDEPFNGIDPIAVKLLRDIIKNETKKGTAVLISSHIIPHLQELCDKIYIIDKGKNVYQGNCKGKELEKIFLNHVTKDGKAQ